jgi:phosphoglycerate dehydrogenase-like enzyme
MRVIYFAPRRDRRAEASGYAVYRSRDRLFREADFVTIHCRLDDTTRSSVGSREFGLMKRTAFLINTARGAIVDQPALVQALREGGIAGAGLDVMEVEPLDPEDPICKVPNVVLLPHIGSATMETRRAMAERSVDNLLAVLSGNRPHGLLNAEVLS